MQEADRMQALTDKIVVFGPTGCGKSTAIKFFCDDVKISDGPEGCTPDCKIYIDRADGKKWIDTIGTEDNRFAEQLSRDEIFSRIMRQVYDNNSPGRVKILWFTNKGQLRDSACLQVEAGFISRFGNFAGTPPEVIWSNVLVVEKTGCLSPEVMSVQGLLHAALQLGAPARDFVIDGTVSDNPTAEDVDAGNVRVLGNVNCLGYSLLDSIGRISLRTFNALPEEHREVAGGLTRDQAKTNIQSRLDAMSGMEMKFQDCTCDKCGQRTDPRMASPLCHVAKRMVHTSTALRHKPGSSASWFHPGTRQVEDGVDTTKSHPRGWTTEEEFDGYRYTHKHSGSYVTVNMCKCGSTDLRYWRCTAFWFKCSWCRCTINSGGSVNHCNTECNNGGHKRGGCNFSCNGTLCDGCMRKKKYWTCCNDTNSRARGCLTKEHRKTRTLRGYACCIKNPKSGGCVVTHTQKWRTECTTCHRPSSHSGCQVKYSCCGLSNPCVLQCCNRKPNTEGCTAKCGECDRLWETGPGCREVPHEFREEAEMRIID